MSLKTNFVIIFVVLLLYALFLLFCWQIPVPILLNDIKFSTNASEFGKTLNKTKPLILIWKNARYIQPFKGIHQSGKCMLTYNRSLIKDADAIIFRGEAIEKNMMPWTHYRDPHQVYIWYTNEAPSISEHHKLSGYHEFDGGFFNWTKTYRHDSDIVILTNGYRGDVLKKIAKGIKAVDAVISKKRKLAIWIVSGCSGRKGQRMRMKYAEELDKAGVNFTRHGRCFKSSQTLSKARNVATELIREHKFYFAFENSIHCTDYITEKFWKNSLASDAVPIVWGPKKEDILSVAPLDSFIFAEDFASASDLADYLKYVDSNDTEYRKYFRWREDETMTDAKMISLTKLRYPNITIYERNGLNECDKLLQNNETKIIDSITEWYVNMNPIECAGIW